MNPAFMYGAWTAIAIAVVVSAVLLARAMMPLLRQLILRLEDSAQFLEAIQPKVDRILTELEAKKLVGPARRERESEPHRGERRERDHRPAGRRAAHHYRGGRSCPGDAPPARGRGGRGGRLERLAGSPARCGRGARR